MDKFMFAFRASLIKEGGLVVDPNQFLTVDITKPPSSPPEGFEYHPAEYGAVLKSSEKQMEQSKMDMVEYLISHAKLILPEGARFEVRYPASLSNYSYGRLTNYERTHPGMAWIHRPDMKSREIEYGGYDDLTNCYVWEGKI